MFSTSLALSVGFLYKIIVIVRPFYASVVACAIAFIAYTTLIRVKKQEPKCR
jgi:hypothetical protein